MVAAIKGYDGYGAVRLAMLWSAYTFCRPGEVRRAEWREIIWDKQEWRIPSEKMKMRREHRVPLPVQCMSILETLRAQAVPTNGLHKIGNDRAWFSQHGVDPAE